MSASEILSKRGLPVPVAVDTLSSAVAISFWAGDFVYQRSDADAALDALAEEVVKLSWIVDHLIAEEHLTPRGRQERRKWLDELYKQEVG